MPRVGGEQRRLEANGLETFSLWAALYPPPPIAGPIVVLLTAHYGGSIFFFNIRPYLGNIFLVTITCVYYFNEDFHIGLNETGTIF